MNASPSTSDLFAAARADAPSDTQHDVIWERVATATGVAAGAATATGAAKTVISGKLLAIGGLIGAAGTALGVVVATTVVMPAEERAAPVASAAPAQLVHSAGAKLADTRTRPIDPVFRDRERPKPAEHVAAVAAPAIDTGDRLAAEAKLVTEARTALVSGDPSRALATVRRTKSLSVRALEPEELSLEARALHALGRADEAAASELELRRRYPDHALAR